MLSSLVLGYTVYKEVKFMQKHLVTHKVFGDLLSTYPLIYIEHVKNILLGISSSTIM